MPLGRLIAQVLAEACALIWRLLLGLVSLGVIVVGFFTHFMGLSSAFEQQNLDAKMLADNPLFAGFSGLIGEAQLGHFTAATMSVAIALGLIYIGHSLFWLLAALEEHAQYRRVGDRTSAQALRMGMLRQVLMMTMLGLLLAWVLNWDLELFRYRAVAGVSGVDDVRALVQSVPGWAGLSAEWRNLHAVQIAYGSGTWGYVSATLLGCLVLEIATWNLREQLVRLSTLLAPQGAPAQIEAATQHDADLAEQASLPAGQEPAAAAADVQPASAADAMDDAPLAPVIGAAPGERVTLAHALAHPQRFQVDPETRTVWARTLWDALHQETRTDQRQAA